jgi:hypothetical protein
MNPIAKSMTQSHGKELEKRGGDPCHFGNGLEIVRPTTKRATQKH